MKLLQTYEISTNFLSPFQYSLDCLRPMKLKNRVIYASIVKLNHEEIPQNIWDRTWRTIRHASYTCLINLYKHVLRDLV